MAKRGKRSGSTVAPEEVAPAGTALPASSSSSSPEITGQKSGQRPGTFKAGAEWTGNSKGRPKGSRHVLSESFISAMAKDFAAHGEEAIKKVREEKPAEYLRAVASIVPKSFDIGDDEDGSAVVGVALITKNAITALIERGATDGDDS